jgi:hypothetical protein
MIAWIYRRWVAVALVLGVALLGLEPFVAARMGWNLFIVLVYLQTPIYMLHQVEEHTGDRFRASINREVFGGVEALTPLTVLWVNIPGVWGITAVSLCLAVFCAAGWGLIGVYLVAVNAAIHVGSALRLRRYNPGLWTATFLFVPLSVLTFWKSTATMATWVHHLAGFAVAAAMHGFLIVHTGRRAAQLQHGAAQQRPAT